MFAGKVMARRIAAPRFLAGVALCLAALGAPTTAAAQDEAIALVVTGPDGVSAATAFETFVTVESEMHLTATSRELPASATVLVRIDTSVPFVRVWRRSDGLAFERRFDGPEDGYALAVVASELLEVARSGGDPRSVGARVVVGESPLESVAPAEALVLEASDGADEIEEPSESSALEASEAPDQTDDVGLAVEGTIGIGVEGWFSISGDPWVVQPTLFAEVLAGPAQESWRLGGSVFASGLGSYAFEVGGFVGSYARQDFGARLSAGGDLGEARTRLLAHVRAGGSLVSGSARPQGDDDEEEASRPGWFLGLGLDLRQPLVEGLEISLDLSADLLPTPVRFTGRGAPLVSEPSVRLAARLGLAWRFR